MKSKMTPAQAGKLGSIKLHENSVKRYLLDPKRCTYCSNVIPYEKRFTNKFCDHSCAATYTNTRRASKWLDKECLHCLKLFKGPPSRKFCCHTCSAQYRRAIRKDSIMDGSEMSTDGTRRKILIEERGYRCEECGITGWNGKPAPLEMHHIDGNSDHNHFNNLQLLCCNCHALTDNHKAKNKGSGRAFRRKKHNE